MTAIAHDTDRNSAVPDRHTAGRVTLGRVVSSEMVKLRTARSMISAITTAALLVVGVGAFAAVGLVVQDPALTGPDAPTADPLGGSLTGVNPAAYAVAALGVIAVTSEYATGTIKPTLAAVPRRAQLVLGKALALTAAVLPLMLAAVLAAFFTAQAILSTTDMSISLTAPGVARAVAGTAVYLTGVTLLGAAFGWLMRSTAGALAALFGVLVVLPVIGLFLPQRVGAAVLPYLPGNAGTAVMQLIPGGQLGPWAGLAVFSAYVVIALLGGAVALRRRDA
ncbi:MAG TPA: ABC transporter permease subunit [Actinoplanes sp.]|jgi:ABC-type transport system involved in multi-copper enzyme maturation permease subunit